MIVRASSTYTRVTRKSRTEKAMVVVRAAKRAMGTVKRKRKGRIKPRPVMNSAISHPLEVMVEEKGHILVVGGLKEESGGEQNEDMSLEMSRDADASMACGIARYRPDVRHGGVIT
jgi:hypothetical protein